MHGNLSREGHPGICVELDGDPVPLVHKHVMVDMFGKYLFKEIGICLGFRIQLIFSMENKSVLVILGVSPDNQKATPKKDGEGLLELVEARTEVKCCGNIHQDER